MNQLKHKILHIFSPRSIISVICISFLNSCVSPTYPVNTHQGNYNPQPKGVHTASNPTIPIIAGAAAIGAIAYYGKKKHDDRKKSYVKPKPKPTVKPHYQARPTKYISHTSRPVVLKPNKSIYHSTNKHSVSRNIRHNHLTKPTSKGRHIERVSSNRNLNRNTIQRTQSARRQQIIESTREQLQRRTSSNNTRNQNIPNTNTKTKDKEIDTNTTRDATRNRQR